MGNTIITHDAAISAFDDAGGVVQSTDTDDGVTFSWDEEHIVRVDAPANLAAAFDTDEFYKIDGATVARPIKQPYLVGDSLDIQQKPATELERAAWTFDNAPLTLDHPDTGMVKDVEDIHGFWRNARYDWDEHRLRSDLYVPTSDEEAMQFIEENGDVSVGFYNRVRDEYDDDTGDLVEDTEDIDGYQVDIYGNHIAAVENGRCSGGDGCGLDSEDHGAILESTDQPMQAITDAPSGIYVADDTWFAVGPDEHTKESTEYANDAMFPVDSCSDVDDAWQLRGHTDNLTIEQSTLANRIQRAAEAKDCNLDTSESQDTDISLDAVEGYHPWQTADSTTEDCGCDTDMTEENDFDIPDLSVDALAEKNEAVAEVVDERDELDERIDEMREEIQDAFDEAEHFAVELDEEECPCEAVEDLVADLDEKADEVEDLRDELSEYRQTEKEDALDDLETLGADREEWADEGLDAIEEEIDRREEVLDAVDADTSVKATEDGGEETNEETEAETTFGRRTFGRGHGS